MKYLALLLTVMLAVPVHAVYINQIFYDSEGEDGGNEWIEIGSNETTSLEGYNLYYSRGIEGDAWSLVWKGSGYILENDYFVIGDSNVEADYRATLNMGNTKGALKLTNNISEDLVGYGEVDYFLGNPALDVDYDNSLQRISNTKDNSVDFVESVPEFHSTSLKQNFTITIKEIIPELEIISISSIEAFPGENVNVEVTFTSDSNYTIEIAGMVTNGQDSIEIKSFTTNINGNSVVSIPLKLPDNLSVGNYTGKLTVFTKS